MLHHFTQSISEISLPEKFTFPFNYTPHPLCVMAAEELQAYLKSKPEWAEEIQAGKMFGVLIVETERAPSLQQEIGFLAAFSGNLDGKNQHEYFVPPVFDMLKKDDFFLSEVKNISAINTEVDLLEKDEQFKLVEQKYTEAKEKATAEIEAQKQTNKANKKSRHERRKQELTKEESIELSRASVTDKNTLKALQAAWDDKLQKLKSELAIFTNKLQSLKHERKTRSAALQNKLFDNFTFLNINGQIKGLNDIFSPTAHKTPPAGAGECAEPKLLQYAFKHNMKPLAMAEFWWGNSPKNEVRHHGQYYPACKGKCEPILGHMLQGMAMDVDPLNQQKADINDIEILFEDEYLLVLNKPAGILSVPGKSDAPSVYSYIHEKYPQATGPLIVHRLDMATSGLLLIAKTKEIHKELQAQFHLRSIKKRYIAVLDGIVPDDRGRIELPLATDYYHRPCQMVDFEHGKPAITEYEVLERKNGETHIAFSLLTGRTHQLRVHSAHQLGLNCPIKGDELYGKKANRLHLHAECLEFTHPISKELIQIEKKAEF